MLFASSLGIFGEFITRDIQKANNYAENFGKMRNFQKHEKRINDQKIVTKHFKIHLINILLRYSHEIIREKEQTFH